MKRFRLVEEGVEMADSVKTMASVLILLSRGGDGVDDGGSRSSSPTRVFACKTCSREFPSFQALGGHRASHKKPRLAADGGDQALAKPKVHECSVCGLEFAIGQALGGHMRRHRAATEGFRHGVVVLGEQKCNTAKDEEEISKREAWLDLNLSPPPEEEVVECRKVGFKTFEFMDKGPLVVDCFH
ncbi:uncharacterized protein [Typha latifolia]|uniref:uncharacterized protein n=1 Tax=Typha latifolia TaxID=4733 RepID=UPI003C2BA0D4